MGEAGRPRTSVANWDAKYRRSDGYIGGWDMAFVARVSFSILCNPLSISAGYGRQAGTPAYSQVALQLRFRHGSISRGMPTTHGCDVGRRPLPRLPVLWRRMRFLEVGGSFIGFTERTAFHANNGAQLAGWPKTLDTDRDALAMVPIAPPSDIELNGDVIAASPYQDECSEFPGSITARMLIGRISLLRTPQTSHAACLPPSNAKERTGGTGNAGDG